MLSFSFLVSKNNLGRKKINLIMVTVVLSSCNYVFLAKDSVSYSGVVVIAMFCDYITRSKEKGKDKE